MGSSEDIQGSASDSSLRQPEANLPSRSRRARMAGRPGSRLGAGYFSAGLALVGFSSVFFSGSEVFSAGFTGLGTAGFVGIGTAGFPGTAGVVFVSPDWG